MGQTRGMSVFSGEGDQEVSFTRNNNSKKETSKLITNTKSGAQQHGNDSVDFFNDRDFYKIFLETSKE